MAFVNDTWLDRTARFNRIKLIEKRINKLERLRKAGALMPSQMDTLITDKKELIRLKRIHRSEYDVLYFGMEYFRDRKSTRLNSSHVSISYAVFCLKKKI